MSTQTIALEVLGGAELRGLERDAADRLLVQPKIVGLLAYLALAGPGSRHLRRDQIVGMFWPELDQAHARAALRKAVYSVRAVLGPDAVVSRGDEELALADGALLCDAVEFTRAVDSGRLAQALELYRGDLLPGLHLVECAEFDRWLESERVSLREQAGASALALAQICERDASLTIATRWARRAARISWSDERILRRALTLLDRVGDRGGALQLYTEFATRLKAELDAEPSAETTALVRQMRA